MPIEFEWLENGGSQNQDILVLWYGDSYIEAKWIFVILFMVLCVVLFIYVKIRDARNVDDTEDIDTEDDPEDIEDPELPTVFESGNTVTITRRSDVIKDSGDDWLSKQRELEDK